MRPAIATVLSPRPWEERLARVAAETGLVRLIARGFDPADIVGVAGVVVGSEAPWLRADHLAGWKAGSMTVVGMYPRGDKPAIARLCAANVDQLFSDDTDPIIILRAVRDLCAGSDSDRSATEPFLGRAEPSSLTAWQTRS